MVGYGSAALLPLSPPTSWLPECTLLLSIGMEDPFVVGHIHGQRQLGKKKQWDQHLSGSLGDDQMDRVLQT